MARFLSAARLILPWLLVASGGCGKSGFKTPEEAFFKLERAIAAGDGIDLFRCLDRESRWAIETTYKNQRLQRETILARYPRAAQARALAPIAAAQEADAPRYFARLARERRLFDVYRRRLGSVSGPTARKDDGQAVYLSRQDGIPFHFRRGEDGWGFDELYREWSLERDRSTHAVQTVRDNAALYKKADQP